MATNRRQPSETHGRHFFRMLTRCQCRIGELATASRTAEKPVEMRPGGLLASEACGSRSCSRWACCCWRSRVTRRSRCCPSTARGRASWRTRPIWSCRVGRRRLEVAERLRPGAGTGNHGAPRSRTCRSPCAWAQAPGRRAGRHRSLPGEGAEVVAPAGLREQAAADRGAGRPARRAGRASWARRRSPSIPRRAQSSRATSRR